MRVAELLEHLGPHNAGMPHLRHLAGSLREMRPKGNVGIASAICFGASDRRRVGVRAFVKTSQNAPRREIDVALRRVEARTEGQGGFDSARRTIRPGDEVREAYDALRPAFTVARAVIEARAKTALTRPRLAERMGAKQWYIARLESGAALPTIRTGFRVAEATGTEPVIGFETPETRDDAVTRQNDEDAAA